MAGPVGPVASREPTQSVAVLDLGASAVRLVVAEPAEGGVRILEEASRGVLLGKDTFSRGRLGAATIEAALKALEGFRRIMDGYGVVRYRAVATSAVREAQNRETFLDRVRLRTGIEVETIDGSEENRLTYMAVREELRGHEALSADSLLVEVGGGSADISFLRTGQPTLSGAYALGSIRMREGLGAWPGGHEQRMRLIRRHVQNVVADILREMPLDEAGFFIALGGDVRFAAEQILGEDHPDVPAVPRDAFVDFCDAIAGKDSEALVDAYRLSPAEAETLVPALVAYRELLSQTSAEAVIVSAATLRAGLLLDLLGSESGQGIEGFRHQVLASAAAFGEKYRYDAPHAQHVALLAGQLFDALRPEHGLADRDRLLLEVAALLHDVGIYVNLRSHHKHSQYLLSVADIFGLSRDDLAVISNVARYHRRAMPQKSHLPYMALDRDARVAVNKLGAILRIANALDADHLQKIRTVRVASEDDVWVLEVEGAGDLTMERLATLARADLFTEVFGRRVAFRESAGRP